MKIGGRPSSGKDPKVLAQKGHSRIKLNNKNWQNKGELKIGRIISGRKMSGINTGRIKSIGGPQV